MSKELDNLSEDLKIIDEIRTKHTKYHTNGIASGTIEMDEAYFVSLIHIAKSNIEKLKQIEDTKEISPNEQALVCLQTLKVIHTLNTQVFPKSYEYCNVIKDALTYKSRKELAFDLIDTKNVDIKLLKWAYPSVEAYNVKVRAEKDYWWREELTKEEFDFLGRMVNAEY